MIEAWFYSGSNGHRPEVYGKEGILFDYLHENWYKVNSLRWLEVDREGLDIIVNNFQGIPLPRGNALGKNETFRFFGETAKLIWANLPKPSKEEISG